MTTQNNKINKILTGIRKSLRQSVTEKSKNSFPRFFKEKIKFYGISSSDVGKIAKTYLGSVEKLTKKDFFILCEELLRSDYCEEAFLVSGWAPKFLNKYIQKDLRIFRIWIDRYINNWAKCDGFCNHTIGGFIDKFPETVDELKVWAKSKNIWMKRAAAVSLIIPAKRGEYLKDVFEISDILLTDPSDMVQKGYGWLLKEASRVNQREVLNFVQKNKKVMPRTALRYAIELMPAEMRKVAMAK